MKHCPVCKKQKQEDEFGFNKSRRDGRQAVCRMCRKEYDRKHYQSYTDAHKKLVRARSTRVREENARNTFDYLLSHPCVDCGESDPVVLEFDHVRGTKKKHVGVLINNSSWATILEEIAKCDVRCANCHRRATAKRHGHKRSRWMSEKTTATKNIKSKK